MRHLKIGVAIILAAGCALPMVERAGAANMSTGLRSAAETLNVVEHVDYSFGGHRYCWYDGGWHGRGWYWCGYADAKHKGSGWGGEEGFHGWKH